jgi:hypothetical protein
LSRWLEAGPAWHGLISFNGSSVRERKCQSVPNSEQNCHIRQLKYKYCDEFGDRELVAVF